MWYTALTHLLRKFLAYNFFYIYISRGPVSGTTGSGARLRLHGPDPGGTDQLRLLLLLPGLHPVGAGGAFLRGGTVERSRPCLPDPELWGPAPGAPLKRGAEERDHEVGGGGGVLLYHRVHHGSQLYYRYTRE